MHAIKPRDLIGERFADLIGLETLKILRVKQASLTAVSAKLTNVFMHSTTVAAYNNIFRMNKLIIWRVYLYHFSLCSSLRTIITPGHVLIHY